MSEAKKDISSEAKGATKSKSTGKKKTRDLDAEIKELFNAFDEDKSKTITVNELKKAMNFLNMAPTKKDVVKAMKTLDRNGNGKIEFCEFKAFLKAEAEKHPECMDPESSIRSAFKVFDRDGNGYIDCKELKYAMTRLGERMTDEEVEDMMREADVDGDGRINYDEFVRVWAESI